MPNNVWGHSILSSDKWESLHASIPPGHPLPKVNKFLDVTDAESDGESQN